MKRYTLTFDNGPDPEVTPRVLDVLARLGVAAHFYVLGKHIATPAGADCASRALSEGHVLGNHSYTHETPLGDDRRANAVEAEIVPTQALLDPLLARYHSLRGGPLFRPFGGGGKLGPHLLSPAARDHLLAHRYTCVLWTSVPRDWEDATGWPDRALADIEAQDHAVVVLHDIANASLAQLDRFLGDAAERSFEATLELPATVLPIVDGVANARLASIVGAA